MSGDLSDDAVTSVIRKHRPDKAACYRVALRASPSLAGTVALRFSVTYKGQVVAAWVEWSTIQDSDLQSCIVSAVRRWTFPAYDKLYIVSYPFILERAASSQGPAPDGG